MLGPTTLEDIAPRKQAPTISGSLADLARYYGYPTLADGIQRAARAGGMFLGSQIPMLGSTVATPIPQVNKSWKDYFSKSAIDSSRGETEFYKSRSTITKMSPKEFLTMAKDEFSPDKMAGVDALVRSGTKFNSIPHLMVEVKKDGTAKVVGHEGRHRMRALEKQGVTEVPVEIRTTDKNPIRWGNQKDEWDRLETSWPQKLVAEDSNLALPFPQSHVYTLDSKPVGYNWWE